ncbi:MAG: QueT transporter family protein [Candidatus Bathyarchaeia archaeon]
MKFESREISLIVFLATIYAVGVVFLAPISFDPRFQVRIADALLPLSIIFGIPASIGFSLGCLIANFFGGLGIIDVIGGGAANFLACTLAWLIGRSGIKRRFLGCIIENLTITVIVGCYLSLIYGIPMETSLLGVFIGSLISINILGFLLLETLYRRGIAEKFVRK